jgi:UDP-N-acetylmuramoyl-L-alanyl-D-glutamate--2,6-diaminopimelate ligase
MKILNELFDNITILESRGNVDVGISSISLSSKNIEKNSLFIAIVGNVLDGHDFIDEVIKKGASVIIHEKDISEFKNGLPMQTGITYIKVENTKNVVGTLASNFYGNPSSKLKLVGVTGTNGKTTTVTLLYQLYKSLGYKVGLISTVVNKINDKEEEAPRTTPDAITLNRLLAEMVDAGCEYCFMEVSSHAVSEKRVNSISFAGGVFTNLTQDHLDYHHNLENYSQAKKGFFEMIPSTGFAISNIDDDKGEYMLDGIKAKQYRLSLKKQADSFGNEVNFNERLETKLLGEFNAYNILSVYAVAILLLYGDKPVSPEAIQGRDKIKEAIKDLEGAPGRFQTIKSSSGVIGIVDYAHTPDALENVLKTANQIKGNGRLISLIGCGGDRDRGKRPIMARIGYDMSDILILTSDNPRTEKPEDILMEMQQGLPLDALDKVEIIVDRHLAIEKACQIAKSGDMILLAGKGHENYQEINGIKHHFDDVEELEKYLR